MPATPTDAAPVGAFLGPETEMSQAIATFDWSTTSLGPIEAWPGELRAAVALMLSADYPCALWWSHDLCLVHNANYERELLRDRGRALGRRFDDLWPDVATQVRPQFDEVLASGRGMTWIDQRIEMERDGVPTETYWTYDFTPLLGREGQPLGIFNGARERTTDIQRQRHDALMIALDDQLLQATTGEAIMGAALASIGTTLAARRVGYGEIDLDEGVLQIRRTWSIDGVPDIAGRYPLGTFGAISDDLRRGVSVTIDDNYTDPRTSDEKTRAIYDRIKLRAGIVVPVLDRGRYVGGLFVQDSQPRRWLRHEVALAEAATARLWQALERLRSDTLVRESEQRYRLIFEQATDIIFTADMDQVITGCNRAGGDALGLEASALIGRSIAEFVSPQDFAQTTAMLRRKLIEGGNTRHEVGVTGVNGRAMRWENNSTLIVDPDRRPIGLLSISRDVTERRAFEDRQKLLINELNHRVKNALALVQGIAHQSFRGRDDVANAQEDFLARLATLAKAHDLLTREQWEGVTIGELVRAATAAFNADRIDSEGPELRLTPKAAVAVSMALHELGTNAMKYGALSSDDGHVRIAWHLGAERLRIDWTEHSGPAVSVPTRRGFGVKMVERALASDLQGTVNIAFLPAGVHCAIDAPREGNVQ